MNSERNKDTRQSTGTSSKHSMRSMSSDRKAIMSAIIISPSPERG